MRPLIIGIAGGSGSGKTTVARAIAHGVKPEQGKPVALLEHDSYYRDRPELSFEQRGQLNFDHPDALETELLCEHLRSLREWKPVNVPVYDFKVHRRSTDVHRLEPAPVVVVEGILIFSEPELRALCDIKIFVDTDADIRAFRRIRRDIEERGRTFDSVREQYYRAVRPMHLQFVEPSKRWADLIVPEGGENRVAVGLVLATIRERMRASHSLVPVALSDAFESEFDPE